jgi:hypothetical protein
MKVYQAFHRRSIDERQAFWREEAEFIHWHKAPASVLDYSNPPFARWFVGGETNLCYNAIDRHLEARGDQPALVYISTETSQEKSYTYKELHAAVSRTAAMMHSHRRHSFGRLRRLRRGQPGGAYRRREAGVDDHGRRRQPHGEGGDVQVAG